mgnify:CR=1 FL=1
MWKLVIINALNSLFKIMEFLIVANAILSWFPMMMQNPTFMKIAAMINSLTQPLLKPIRKLMSKTAVGGMPIDISPIIAILLLGVLQNILMVIIAVI